MRLSVPFIVLVAVFLYRAPSRYASGATDVDFYWHLQYGDWILDNLRLPTHDVWSWTAAGEPYRLTQWLGEVVMAAAYRLAGGDLGTQVLSAALVALTIAFSYQAAHRYLPNRLAALFVALACDAILLSLACRPHQFTHLGLAVLTAILARYHQTQDRQVLAWLPVTMALWVNLHGGYAVGLAYLWLLVTAVWAECYMSNGDVALRRNAIALSGFAVLSTVATLFNPYGVGAWGYAIEVASLKSSSAGIVDEWGPTNIKLDAGLMWFLAVTATAAAMAVASRRPRLQTLLVFAALAAAGWSAIRVSLMTTILLVPILAAALRDTPIYSLAFDGPASKYDRTVPVWVAAIALIVVLAGSIGVARFDRTPDRVVADTLPVREVAFMKAAQMSGRIVNSPEVGGYLIRHLGQPVSLDTRFDLYGDHRLFEFMFARRGDVLWRNYLERLDPDILLIDNLSALRQLAMDTRMYRLVFHGPRYSILVRPDAYPSLPTKVPTSDGLLILNQLAP